MCEILGARGDEEDGPMRIGVLGAARIAPAALVKPARVAAVAARDRRRAEAFALRT